VLHAEVVESLDRPLGGRSDLVGDRDRTEQLRSPVPTRTTVLPSRSSAASVSVAKAPSSASSVPSEATPPSVRGSDVPSARAREIEPQFLEQRRLARVVRLAADLPADTPTG